MKNMSFSLTTPQFCDRQKVVTRRNGWWDLKPGDLLCGVLKGMGLKPGEQIERLAIIVVVSAVPEPLRRMTDDLDYGFKEIALEGFADHPQFGWPSTWVPMFCEHHKGCTPDSLINRIEFRFVPGGRA